MIRIVIFAVALGIGVLALGTTSARADKQVGSYTGRCAYRCCDQNNNCAVNSFYSGSGQGALPYACAWDAVCAKQGQIGWSWSPYPLSEKNSSLTYTKGCWQGWRAGQYGDGNFYVKPC
jgi:hypothetical protein